MNSEVETREDSRRRQARSSRRSAAGHLPVDGDITPQQTSSPPDTARIDCTRPSRTVPTSTSPEVNAFLASQRNLILGTTRSDGAPQLTPVWFLWTGTSFLISTIDTTAKWANLIRDNRCSTCVDDPDTGRMVVAYGEAALRTQNVELDTRRLVSKYYPGDLEGTDAHMTRIFDGRHNRMLIDVVPNRLITRCLG